MNGGRSLKYKKLDSEVMKDQKNAQVNRYFHISGKLGHLGGAWDREGVLKECQRYILI